MRLLTPLTALALVGCAFADSYLKNACSCEAVTKTVTVSICQSEAALASAVSSESFSTITSYSTLTNFVTVTPSQTLADPISSSAAVLSSSSGYSFIAQDGTTSWIGGASPDASFSSFVTETVQVTVFPIPSGEAGVTITQTTILTVIPPAVTSFVPQPSMVSAASSEDETTTSTVTSYLTKSVISVHTVYLTSKSSKSATSHSIHTVTGPSTSTTITVKEASTSESVCSVSFVDVTTDITYTVLATPSAGFTSAPNSAGNLGSLAGAAPASNATLHPFATLTGSSHQSSSWLAGWSLTGSVASPTVSLISSVSISAVSQQAPGENSSLSTVSVTGYVPFMPGPVMSLSAIALLRPSSTLTKMYTNTSSAMPMPTVCGEHGNFTLNWEDGPDFAEHTRLISEPSAGPPIFNPYHHMYFSDGFVYAAPGSRPFGGSASDRRLVMFVANNTGDSDNHNEGGQLPGEFGAGIRRSSSAFWFNAHSALIGCDGLDTSADCTVQITGLVYNNETKAEFAAFEQTVMLPPCSPHTGNIAMINCQLTEVRFAQSMQELSGLRVQAFSNAGTARSWFMGDLTLGWSNNTCAAGLLRGRSQ
ncbi:hypothetical protein E4T47_06859 [Aureobasidium subglaciale]|nr:hypothetical protein E4T47_06859 [Aureobasidium subglaciale]